MIYFSNVVINLFLYFHFSYQYFTCHDLPRWNEWVIHFWLKGTLKQLKMMKRFKWYGDLENIFECCASSVDVQNIRHFVERSAKNLGSIMITMDTNLYAKPRVNKTTKMSSRYNWRSRLLTCTLIYVLSCLLQGLCGIQAATFTSESDSSTYVYEGKTTFYAY